MKSLNLVMSKLKISKKNVYMCVCAIAIIQCFGKHFLSILGYISDLNFNKVIIILFFL